MEKTAINHPVKETEIRKRPAQPKWQRIILLSILGYEAAGCLFGGSVLIAAPDGSLMGMPVELMNGIFHDFLIPGIFLFGLGIINTIAFITVLRKTRFDWVMAGLAMGGLAIWFWIEIAILQELHWLHAMWGLPVILGALTMLPLFPSGYVRKGLLISGIFSSLLYAAINIIVAMQWEAYDSASQTVSELSAVDAPTRMLWLVLSAPYTLFMITFAWGVWKSTEGNRCLHIAGGLLVAYGVLGILWPFAPMHLRETLAVGGATFSDTVHIALGVVTEIIYLLALGFAAAALGKPFRLYCIATFAALLVFAILTFTETSNVPLNGPTPMIGVWERINIGVFLLWVIVLAVQLWRAERIPAAGKR